MTLKSTPDRGFVAQLVADLYPNRPAFYDPKQHDHLELVASAEEDVPPAFMPCVAHALSDGSILVVRAPHARFYLPGQRRFHGLNPISRRLAHQARRAFLDCTASDSKSRGCPSQKKARS
jgi:hypothetical protein